jgi:1-acyl-sn-glycerol-3-phosphate acyltransferase
METFRGGLLLVIRWLFHYPFILGTYRVRGATRSPFRLDPALAEKPGILVSNSGNYFFDDVLGLSLGPVWPFYFVRDSLYRMPVLNWVFRFFRALPIVRVGDARFNPQQRQAINRKVFAQVAGLLRKGHWLSVFPEPVSSHRSRLLKPLRPGVAFVALRAEDASGWGLGLRIYVYGANYENKLAGRSNLFIRWAAPIEVARYRDIFMRDPGEAEEVLMQELEQALHSTVLEAPTLEALSDAHRLAHQRRQPTFPGVQGALGEVIAGSAAPEELHKIVCRRRESVVYQVLGYVLLGFGWSLGWPFRMFGRLCADDRSQEMSFQFILWLLVLVAGAAVSEWHWAKFQIIATWGVTTMWLWAWRRGIIDQSS